ncbi:hypothetical protein M514_11113 [Trichuris suis]|uniref:Serine/threonine-protein phosphatase n=1 Tax=Trichuris suis TaxID=68888 RepID=A0A085NH80_9BILA|nr:hypothetical protein M513_11113 [Trichuris suis]KFD68826.1 hypothetical protein M514_11113 [Trichuris suis]KHJ45024.1 phosphoprotein phosphatase 1 [Trichuris suis]
MDRGLWTDVKDRLLMQVRRKNTQPVTLEEVNTICHFARETFSSQPPLLEIEPPVNICGDIHGQFEDLIRLFNNGRYPPTSRYLFLGDYVDRGPMSIEVILLLMLYKIRFPNHMFLLRGNHEFDNINNIYGFYMEVMNRYRNPKMWKLFNQTFMYMPLAALVGGRILCMHGGISMELNNFDQIRTIRRPLKVPYSNLTCDLVWADPCKTIVGWQRNIRGASYMFGENVVHQFCQVMDIDMIARAHQVVPKGYEFFANNKLVTLFSAPNYCGEYDNDAAMMHVNKDMHCDIKQFRGHRRRTR